MLNSFYSIGENYINSKKDQKNKPIIETILKSSPSPGLFIFLYAAGKCYSYTEQVMEKLIGIAKIDCQDMNIRNLALKTMLKIIDSPNIGQIKCVKDYALELIETDEKEVSLELIKACAKKNSKVKSSELKGIINNPKTREIGFKIAKTMYGDYGIIDDFIFETKDHLFWDFICDLYTTGNTHSITREKIKKCIKEIDPAEITISVFSAFVKNRLENEDYPYIINVVKLNDDINVRQKGIDIIKRDSYRSNIVQKELMKLIDDPEDVIFPLIPLYHNFIYKDPSEIAKLSGFPHCITNVINVKFKVAGNDTVLDVKVTPEMIREGLNYTARSAFNDDKLEVINFLSIDTVKSKNIKEGDTLCFERKQYTTPTNEKMAFIGKIEKSGVTEKLVDMLEKDITEEDSKYVYEILQCLRSSVEIASLVDSPMKFIERINTTNNNYLIRYILQVLLKSSEEELDKFFSECDINEFINTFILMNGTKESFTELFAIFEKRLQDCEAINNPKKFITKLIDFMDSPDISNNMFAKTCSILSKAIEKAPDVIRSNTAEIMPKISNILTTIDMSKWNILSKSIYEYGINNELFQIAKENNTKSAMIDIIGHIGLAYSESIPQDEYIDVCFTLLSSESEQNIEKGVKLLVPFIRANVERIKGVDLFEKVFNIFLQTSGGEEKKLLFQLITDLSTIKLEWRNPYMRHVDELIDVKNERFNYDPSFFRQSTTKNVGINNLHSTCFFASVIQQLAHLVPFTYKLFHLQSEGNETIMNLQRLIAALLISKEKSVDPKAFISCWKGWGGEPINPREQQDASEFLTVFLDTLPEDMQAPFKGTIEHTITAYDDPENILIQNEEKFTSISLTVQSFKTMNDSLKSFIKPDQLIGNNQYEHNKEKIDAKHYVKIKDPPDILVITLRRFEYNTQTGIRHKINDEFEICENFNLKELMVSQEEDIFYDIKGIVIHTGTANSGHYISLIKADDWLEFNDSDVATIRQKTAFDNAAAKGPIPSSNAYILIYAKRDQNVIDDGKIVHYNDLKLFIPPEIKKEIEIKNRAFELIQFAFSSDFLEVMKTMEYKKRLNFMANVVLHAKYDIYPKEFMDNIIKEIPNEKETTRDFIMYEKSRLFEAFVFITQKALIQSFRDFFEKATSVMEYIDHTMLYKDLVNYLPNFIENKRNLGEVLSIISLYICSNEDRELFAKTYVEPLVSFYDEIYTQSAGRSQMYISSIEIPDLINVFVNYAQVIDKDVILKHAQSVILSPANKGQFSRLLYQMLKHRKISIDELMAVFNNDVPELWKDVSSELTTPDAGIPKELVAKLLEAAPALNYEIISDITSKSSPDNKQEVGSYVAPVITKTMLVSSSKQARVAAKKLIFDAFPILDGLEQKEEYEENFRRFIESFDEVWFSLSASICGTCDSDNYCELFDVFRKAIPFLNESSADSAVEILGKLFEYNKIPCLNIYSLLVAMGYYDSRTIEQFISSVAQIVITSIEDKHIDMKDAAPVLSPLIKFGESFNCDDLSSPFANVVKNQTIQNAFGYFFKFSDNSQEFLILLEFIARFATADISDEMMVASLNELITGITEQTLSDFPKNCVRLIHASATITDDPQCAHIIEKLFLLINTERYMNDNVKEELARLCEFAKSFPYHTEVSNSLEENTAVFKDTSYISSVLFDDNANQNMRNAIQLFIISIGERSEKISEIIFDALMKDARKQYNTYNTCEKINPVISVMCGLIVKLPEQEEKQKAKITEMIKLIDPSDTAGINHILQLLYCRCNESKQILIEAWKIAHRLGRAIDPKKKHGDRIIRVLLEENISEIAAECLNVYQSPNRKQLQEEEVDRFIEISPDIGWVKT